MNNGLSLCMVVKDEEKNLKRFLNLVISFIDELVIVDTGSRDNTKNIAKNFNAKIYDFKWDDDFSKARNFSISKATMPWILVLDPDEEIEKKDLVKIRSLIGKANKNVLGYRLIQKTIYNGKVVSVRGICRLFRRNEKIRFTYPIHETVREQIRELGGRIGKTGITIEHYPRISKEKQEYYLRLLMEKKKLFPNSNVDKEIENEKRILGLLEKISRY